MSWAEAFVALLVAQLAGDFILQTEFQALNKVGGLGRDRMRRKALLSHIATYALPLLPVLVVDRRRARAPRGRSPSRCCCSGPISSRTTGAPWPPTPAPSRRPTRSPGTPLWIGIDQSFHALWLLCAALIAARPATRGDRGQRRRRLSRASSRSRCTGHRRPRARRRSAGPSPRRRPGTGPCGVRTGPPRRRRGPRRTSARRRDAGRPPRRARARRGRRRGRPARPRGPAPGRGGAARRRPAAALGEGSGRRLRHAGPACEVLMRRSGRGRRRGP